MDKNKEALKTPKGLSNVQIIYRRTMHADRNPPLPHPLPSLTIAGDAQSFIFV